MNALTISLLDSVLEINDEQFFQPSQKKIAIQYFSEVIKKAL